MQLTVHDILKYTVRRAKTSHGSTYDFLEKKLLCGIGARAHPAIVVQAQQVGWEDLNTKAQALYRQGRYDDALVSAKEALRLADLMIGSEHTRKTATSLSGLALIYEARGDYGAAEPLAMRCLTITEDALGADHLQTAVALSNMARVYYFEGKLAEAEPLFTRALTIEEDGYPLHSGGHNTQWGPLELDLRDHKMQVFPESSGYPL